MDSVKPLIEARNTLLYDFFGGWNESDADLLQPHQYRGSFPEIVGEMVDWLGIRTDLAMHAWLPVPPTGFVHLPALPIPSDQVHAEAIEYIALIVALERAIARGGSSITVMELGASYGPWVTAAGVLARRNDFRQISLIAVEASKKAVAKISEHAARNALDQGSDVVLTPIHAAMHVDDAIVYFPRVDVSSDNGAQLSTAKDSIDYRGVPVEYDEVEGITLTTLCHKIAVVDFLHLDLQGAEERLLLDPEFLETLDQKVVTFFLATQSRLIEGLALRALSNLGWRLVRERPTAYQQNDRTVDINGWTTRDGGQLWLNPRFGAKHFDL